MSFEKYNKCLLHLVSLKSSYIEWIVKISHGYYCFCYVSEIVQKFDDIVLYEACMYDIRQKYSYVNIIMTYKNRNHLANNRISFCPLVCATKCVHLHALMFECEQALNYTVTVLNHSAIVSCQCLVLNLCSFYFQRPFLSFCRICLPDHYALISTYDTLTTIDN